MKKIIYSLLKWLSIIIIIFIAISALLYLITSPKNDRDWTIEHAKLPLIQIQGESKNPDIFVKNVRDFHWTNADKVHYKNMNFKLKNIVELKAIVSHFSAISEIAHVFMSFVLDDGRELGVSIEARREKGESFSLQGGLLAQFEIIYVLASPEDLLGTRKISGDELHSYPIKESTQKAQELFLLIANEVNTLYKKPALYHLFFKNCTNQLVKNVSILTDEKYPWYFQTLAPGLTGRTLYELGLIDMPSNLSFEEIQEKTLIR